MTDKAYIVANEQQECEVLGILGTNGLKYVIGTYSKFRPLTGFPYVIYESDTSNVLKSGRVPKIKYSTEIVFDGRKEEQMSEKYVVSQEFMNKLEDWKSDLKVNGRYYIYEDDIYDLPSVIENWWKNSRGYDKEANNRLIAIIRWVNGEDVFEVEKPKKWVVRSNNVDSDGETAYVDLVDNVHAYVTNSLFIATRFDTKEEAQSWANAHQEVIEVEA